MLLRSGALRILAQAQVVFGAGQGLGRVEDLPLHAVAVPDLLRGLPVTPPGPGRTEGRGVRGQQRRANQRPDPGAEAVERQADHGSAPRHSACSAARRLVRPRTSTPPARFQRGSWLQAPTQSPALARRARVERQAAEVPTL